MKKLSLIFIISFIIIILQQALFSSLTFLSVSADVIYVYIICNSLIRDDVESLFVALFCGLIKDCFFPYLFGVNTIIYIITALLVGKIEKKIYKDAIVIPMLFTFIATIFKGLLYYSFFYIVAYNFSFKAQMYGIQPIEALYNSVISIFMFKFIKKIGTLNVMQQDWNFNKRREYK